MSGRGRPPRERRADLSQHFLREGRAARLIQATSISRSDFVIEIGAGRGALTKPLMAQAGRLLAVEVDRFLAEKLVREVGHRVEVAVADFLSLALPTEPYKVIGNVPYSIASGIVRKLITSPTPPTDGWLIVQRELAHRLCGRPYTNESLWSLRLKPHWHLEIVDRLKRTDFDPPPSVDSVMLWMSNRGRPLISDLEAQLYLEVIESAFRHGATIQQAIRPRVSRIQLRRLAADLRFDPNAAPSAILFEQWLGILRFLRHPVA